MFYMSRSSFLTLPAGGECRPYRPPCVLRLMPTSLQVRASLVETPLLSASTNDRCGFRVERLPSPSPLSLSPTPFLRRGVGPLSFRLRQQTLFDGYVPAFAATPPKSGCWPASLRCQPGNLRLLFRLTRTGICTASSGRRTAAIRHHPPTRKRTDERTVIRPWHSLHYSPRAGSRRLRLFSPPGTWLMQWHFDRSFPQSLAAQAIADSEHRCSRVVPPCE